MCIFLAIEVSMLADICKLIHHYLKALYMKYLKKPKCDKMVSGVASVEKTTFKKRELPYFSTNI